MGTIGYRHLSLLQRVLLQGKGRGRKGGNSGLLRSRQQQQDKESSNRNNSSYSTCRKKCGNKHPSNR